MNNDQTAPCLALRDLSFGYEPGEPVLREVSAELPAGRLCVMLGPNAAGKSTLLRLVLGLHQAWSGSVRVVGQDLAQLSPRQRARVMSYVPQRTAVEFAFSVEQVVTMARFALEPSHHAVEQALDACDLIGIRHRPFNHLSTGQQQRVLLGRAMAQAHGHGRIMVLDEPGSAMDLWHLHRMMRQLRELAAAGLAVLVVLHDLNLAARYADLIWLMDGGRIVAAGAWQQVMTPQVLEPVYRVKLAALTDVTGDRPVFSVRASDGL